MLGPGLPTSPFPYHVMQHCLTLPCGVFNKKGTSPFPAMFVNYIFLIIILLLFRRLGYFFNQLIVFSSPISRVPGTPSLIPQSKFKHSSFVNTSPVHLDLTVSIILLPPFHRLPGPLRFLIFPLAPPQTLPTPLSCYDHNPPNPPKPTPSDTGRYVAILLPLLLLNFLARHPENLSLTAKNLLWLPPPWPRAGYPVWMLS